jgi:hypothetical protein
MTGKLKAWGQVLAAVLAGLIPFLVDHHLDGVEITNAALLLIGGITLYIVPNLTGTEAKYAKLAVSVGAAFCTLLVSFFADGSYAIDSGEWIQLGLAALGALGVARASALQFPATPARIGPDGVPDISTLPPTTAGPTEG